MTGRLVARGLRQSFGDLVVLDGVDLSAAAGEVLAVLGPSGCGKSTLLRALAGFQTYEGSVTVDGQPVLGPSPSRGMVAQSGGLLPWLTLRANLGFGPSALGRPAVEVRSTVDELLVATGLSDFADALPGILTGSILAASRAIGETAPLITIGALTLVLFTPNGPLDTFTVLPIQIFNWVSRPQAEFHQIAAAGIMVLLAVLLTMNSLAIVLRQRLQRRF